MWYHRKFKLRYDANVFNDIIEYAKTAEWKQGYDQNGLIWNIEELPLKPEQFPILNELYEGLNAEFKRPSFFLSNVKPGGLESTTICKTPLTLHLNTQYPKTICKALTTLHLITFTA